MYIDSYQFGSIIIDGKTYTNDCIITADKVLSDWWRKHGHLLTAEDIKPIIEFKPSILIVGSGASGMMKIAEDIRHILQEINIELLVFNTEKAVTKFNELTDKGENVAAVLHLTC